MAGIAIEGETSSTVDFVAGAGAKYDFVGEWLAVVTTDQALLPVVACDVHPDTVPSKDSDHSAPITVKP